MDPGGNRSGPLAACERIYPEQQQGCLLTQMLLEKADLQFSLTAAGVGNLQQIAQLTSRLRQRDNSGKARLSAGTLPKLVNQVTQLLRCLPMRLAAVTPSQNKGFYLPPGPAPSP